MGKHGKYFPISGVGAKVLISLTITFAALIGIGLGVALAETANIINTENFEEFTPALPTRILDIHGTVITEFAADERRELVPLDELPRHLIHAVLAREDPDFFNHRGFTVRAISRAAFGFITGRPLGGGSTITQQLAGTLHADRRERTIRRKIRELWWALQIERRFSKNEILEMYLNYMYMGPGTFGVEAASRFFFGKSARDITLAEAAILVIQLSAPVRYNPFNHPNVAMNRQRFVLDRMIEFGFTTPEEADASFIEYWNNFDFTRSSLGAYFFREDRAPWFSEFVRRELAGLMFGTMDFHRDGFTVHTTLNLQHQEAAERYMAEALARANREHQLSRGRSQTQAERTYTPVVQLLSLLFDLHGIHATSAVQNEQVAQSRYTRIVNPVVDLVALAFNIPDLKVIADAGTASLRTRTERNVVEGALISIENETGHITAIVGGSRFDQSNQLIRATQSVVQPGSAFKPLFFSAALDNGQFTAASLIYDVPVVFHNEDGTPYIPNNFRGIWSGPVLLHTAMSRSMNIPALKILDAIGFDAAINRSAALMGITDPVQIQRSFPRVYPLALGVNSTSPVRMARAFAVFGNEGRAVTPIAIRRIEDRNGRVIIDQEREMRMQQRRAGTNQIISEQNAYVMSRILERVVTEGTLAHVSGRFTFRDENGRAFRMPVAGKTGTTQNWADAWVVGHSAYYTSAVWFGFDRPGNSLGTTLTGSTLAGPVFGNYMRAIHQGLPFRDFARPAGIVDVTVCARSGMLRTSHCNEGSITLPFIAGSQPTRSCTTHGGSTWSATVAHSIRGNAVGMLDEATLLGSISPLFSLPDDLFIDMDWADWGIPSAVNTGAPVAPAPDTFLWSFDNWLLDGDDGAGSNPTGGTSALTEPEEQAGALPPPAQMPEPEGATDPRHGVEIPAFNPFLN